MLCEHDPSSSLGNTFLLVSCLPCFLLNSISTLLRYDASLLDFVDTLTFVDSWIDLSLPKG
jgi:hypothetical protein